MAQVTRYKASIVNFDKSSSWTDGPLKPSTTTVTQDSSYSNISSAVASALANVAAGESLCVVVTAETVET